MHLGNISCDLPGEKIQILCTLVTYQVVCEEIVGNIETDKKVAALSTCPLISYLDSDEERTVNGNKILNII